MRSLELNIAVLAAQKDRRGCRAASLALSGHARTRAGLRNASASWLLDWRWLGRRRWRRAVERHPVDDCQHGNRSWSVLGMLVAVLLKQHDRHNLAVVLIAVEPVTQLINQQHDGLDGAIGRCLEDHLDASVGAVEALHVDAPFLLPRKCRIGHIRDQRLRLSDGNKTFANHFVAVAEGDAAPLDRQRIDGPPAAFFGNGAPLPKSPSAAIFSTLEEHHRQSGAPDTDWDISERCLKRRHGGECTSRWRRDNWLAFGLF